MGQNNGELKLILTQDKLMDFLLHAATREDISKLDVKIDKIESKFDSKFERVDEKFEKINSRFNQVMWGIIFAILVPIALHFIA